MSNIARMDDGTTSGDGATRASVPTIAGLEQGILRVSTDRGERTYVLAARTQPDASGPALAD